MRIPDWKNPSNIFRKEAGPLAKYLTWKQIDNHFEIGTKKNVVTIRINEIGKSLISYNGDYN